MASVAYISLKEAKQKSYFKPGNTVVRGTQVDNSISQKDGLS